MKGNVLFRNKEYLEPTLKVIITDYGKYGRNFIWPITSNPGNLQPVIKKRFKIYTSCGDFSDYVEIGGKDYCINHFDLEKLKNYFEKEFCFRNPDFSEEIRKNPRMLEEIIVNNLKFMCTPQTSKSLFAKIFSKKKKIFEAKVKEVTLDECRNFDDITIKIYPDIL